MSELCLRAWRDPNAAAVWSGDFMDAAISPGGKVTSPGRAKKITWVEGGGGVGGVVKVFQSYKPFSEEWPTWGERGNTGVPHTCYLNQKCTNADLCPV